MSALSMGLAAWRERWLRVLPEEARPSEAEVLRGLGLARSGRVSYEVGASGRVKAVHQAATPDASSLRRSSRR